MSLWMRQRIHFRDQPPGQNAITQKPPLASLERVLRGLVIMMPFMFIHIPFMYCYIYILLYYIYICICIHTYIHTYIYTYDTVCVYIYIYIHISYVYINLHALRISPYFHRSRWQLYLTSQGFLSCRRLGISDMGKQMGNPGKPWKITIFNR